MIGATLLHYRIVEALGRGGMGEVYAAEDTKLGRRVALKLLPQEMAADTERLHRFQREAQALALLNHPNLVTIYSVEEAAETHFITMELVEGKTLGELTPPRGWPIREFLRLAIPLADAIGTAHLRGIIHRDLKPANVMVGSDGRVKVLDFGLAKLKQEDVGSADVSALTTTEQLTAKHSVFGTAAYMSPEQAEGRPLDHRTDIFSLGVVLYELATGRRPFQGDTAVSVISSILKDSPPPPVQVNPDLPGDLDRIIGHCLAKDPARRYQSALDVRNDLQELQQRAESPERLADVSRTTISISRTTRWRLGVAAAVALIAVGTYVLLRRGTPAGREHRAPLRATFSQLTTQPGVEWFPSLSPDGKWIAYSGEASGNRDIYLQSVNGQNPINLTADSPAEDDQPAFSPDGESIAFRSSREGGGIFVMGRTGEAVRRVARIGFEPAWSPDGTRIAFTSENVDLNPQNQAGQSEIWIVGVNGGEPRRIEVNYPDHANLGAVHASWSPNGHRIACAVRLGGQLDVWTIPSGGGTPTPVTRDPATDWNPVWAPDGGHLYFVSNRGGSMNLWSVPIDEESGRTIGDAEPVTTPATFVAHPSISADGRRLVYSSVLKTANIQKLSLDPSTGNVKGEPVWLTTGSQSWSSPDPSSDGQWIAFYSLVQPEGDVFVVRADGTGLRQVTSDRAIDRMPRWSPDGKWLFCFSNRSGLFEIWKVRPDGSELSQVTEARNMLSAVFSPDGSRLAAGVPGGNARIFDPNRPWKEQQPQVLPNLENPRRRFTPNSWSPDGKLLAGLAGESLKGVVTYSLSAGTFEELDASGEWPVFLPDSRRLLFVSGGKRFLIQDIASKKTREIFSVTRDVIGPPRLTRDGREAYYSRRVTEADIWLMTLQ